MIALIIDMEISNTAHLTDQYISSDVGAIIFTLISLIYLVSQQFILSYSHKRQFQIQIESSSFRIIQRLINFMILLLIIGFLTIVLEVIISGYYNSIFLLVVLVVTNSITIFAMVSIGIKFFSWYKSSRKSTILVFGVMSSTIAITALVTILFMGTILLGQPDKIDSDYDVVLPVIEQGSTLSVLNYLYYYLSILSFVVTSFMTSLLLKDYSIKLGKFRYWAFLSIPLAFYLSQLLVTQFGFFIPKEDSDQLTFSFWFLFLYTLSSPIGGMLFCLPYFLVIRKMNIDKSLQSYMKILAYALLLFFVAGSATVYHTPYPPFGLSTVSIIGPSSYLIAIGVYYSARLVSSNRTIENQMRSSKKYSQFFASIGSAEMEKAMTEIIEEIRKKLPAEKDETPEDPLYIDKEIIDNERVNKIKKAKSNSTFPVLIMRKLISKLISSFVGIRTDISP
ncbi:MAG: hypothetical protein ACRD97_11215 [Nitrososphaeraceae archaeon]